MIDQNTHKKINESLSGTPIKLTEGYSKIRLTTTKEMILDESGLIHGGFTFSLADYAAMLAVNHPNVVLTKAEVNFIKPVLLGDTLIAEGMVKNQEGKKSMVNVIVGNKNNITVLEGTFICYSPDQHIIGGGS
ncbi:MAG: hotdog fold thioesterase [Candidatus Lokiarchaeota archaeon]|nr:hotdog fold thioesterase [Candidatus Lokiarchaeota archaeon]